VAKTLQLAIRAVTPHQREVRCDFPVASCSLASLLILAAVILTTNGAAGPRALPAGLTGRGAEPPAMAANR
jgi:hypothetical protein